MKASGLRRVVQGLAKRLKHRQSVCGRHLSLIGNVIGRTRKCINGRNGGSQCRWAQPGRYRKVFGVRHGECFDSVWRARVGCHEFLVRQAEAGQRVQAGQVLAEVDVQDYALAAQAAQAQVIGARSQRDLAAADFKRYEALLAQNFISAAELERRSATLKAAQATLDQALAQAQSQSNQAGYAKLMATSSGVITGVEAEPGQVVSAGQPVVRFAQDGPRDAVFAVPEHVVGRLKLGQKMTATVGNGNQTVQGHVREIGASADPATRTFTVKLGLEKAEALPLGITLNVHAPQLAGSQSNVIKVPTSALRQEGQQTTVWLFDTATSTVSSQVVQVATADGNDVVITSGLKPGQQIVSAGVHVLSPGQKVTVYNPEALTPPASK
ncbi:MAG: efflux RND transporter periplasmic adaptor subunit [Betaproteobacteria bacterium]|nr:efflux RND transporter periplasmic adaptor subunit [Betaproteobacteria bacterium]